MRYTLGMNDSRVFNLGGNTTVINAIHEKLKQLKEKSTDRCLTIGRDLHIAELKVAKNNEFESKSKLACLLLNVCYGV